ncbi:DUF3800 domain-containing protein [Demequina subtropica]|uniref:DUF3800 domain-containing protein n=1 Tax=Demequina subtropica TaxID=1638989 RepID=UPI00078176CA|nr:DUF3800 domain-containing protein [Demequina subtropica]
MLLFYVDESGGTTMNVEAAGEGRTPVRDLFALAAVGIHDSSREPLAEEILRVKERHFGTHAVSRAWGETEIKSRHLWLASRWASGEFPGGLPTGYANVLEKMHLHYLLRDLGQLFAKFRPLVFSVVVDKRALAAVDSTLNPLGIAYARLYERVAQTLGSVNRGEGAIFVADRQDEHEAYFNSGSMHEVRQGLASKGANRPNFNLVVDKPVWIDPTLSTWDRELIQLADLVAFATRAWYGAGQPPTDRHLLWDKIEPCFAAHWNTTKAQGGGIIVFPDPGKYPPVR